MSCFRPTIDAMAGYVPGEQPRDGNTIKLNTNENPYPPSPKVIEAIVRAANDGLRRYPDPLATPFRESAGQALGVPPEWILACNGSDDALTILTRACVSEADLMVAPTPSYPLYRVLAQIQGCRFEHRPFNPDWSLPADFAHGSRLALVPNPNSPTGTFLAPAQVRTCANQGDGLFVVDEAYADFAAANCLSLVKESPRVVVTRSLSKSHGLAGIRFGYVVAQPAVIQTLIKVKDSYNCDALSIAAAAAAMADQEYYREVGRKVRATRGRLTVSMRELGFDVLDSLANFVWCQRSEPVEPVYQALKARHILVRYLRYPSFGDGLRISVGTDAEINELLDALRQIL